MIPYNLQHITLMQLEIFFQCAEYNNFTKAAAALQITPGMVSKKIAALETALGFPLFLREKNRVVLTPQGTELSRVWRQSTEAMVQQASLIQSQENCKKTVSFSLLNETNLERYFVPLISAYSADQDILFHMRINQGREIIEDIASGKADITFVPDFFQPSIAQYDWLEYFQALFSPLYAALSADDPLSKKTVLEVSDLENVELLIPANGLTCLSDMLRSLCQAHGFEAKLKLVKPDVFEANYLFMDPGSILVVDKYFSAFSSNAVEFREIAQTQSGLLMVYRKNLPPHVRQLVDFARRFFKELR